MRFFKSKAQKKAEAEEAKQKVLDGIQQQIDDAKKCADPAERFLKLEDIGAAIDTLTGKSQQDIHQTARGKFHLAYLGVGTGTVATITAAAIVLHFPPALFFFLGIPGIYTGTWAGEKRAAKEQARLMAENKPFFDALDMKRQDVTAGTDAILKNELNTLAASARFEEIVKKAPRVRDHFTAAFARQIANKENPPAPPPKPHGGFKL